MKKIKRHIICEKDVGLFSLIQQVISHIPFALAHQAYPVVLFGNKCCYWTPEGYADRHNVWEYYFEPLIDDSEVNTLPTGLMDHIGNNPPYFKAVGYFWNEETFVSNHFGNHKGFGNQTLRIPYKWKDPDFITRNEASKIIQSFVRPRHYIIEKVNLFFELYMQHHPMVGVHIRATDVSNLKTEYNIQRRYSFNLTSYVLAIEKQLKDMPGVRFFVATDSMHVLQVLTEKYDERILYYSSIFQTSAEVTGKGAMGWKMPAYLTQDSQKAARNGEEAVIDYLLLSQCSYLIHNGSGLARTVLLNKPAMPHENLHTFGGYLRKIANPTNMEFLYVSRILLQKIWWWFAEVSRNGLRRFF